MAATTPGAPGTWWRDAVIYQVYVRSFADTDGDGIGDLGGVRSRLPYLRQLGVDAVWLTPFYPSPQRDAGYDVADYRDVDPRFGTLHDFDGLVADAHALGIRVIVDIVPNHTSSDHVWFQAALAASPRSRERARYLFREGRGADGATPPNDWVSTFGGPAWTRVTEPDGTPGQWYLHLFDSSQPDLDWTNPEVVEEFESILRFWLDRDVDGFRIDVAHGLAKDSEMPDLAGRFEKGPHPSGHPHWDQDAVHEVYRGWRRIIDEYEGDRVFVGEIWLQTTQQLARYLRPGELHTAFNFHFLLAQWSEPSMRTAIDASIGAMADVGAPATWVLANHDVVREVTRYGDGEVGRRRARAAALLMLALPGSAYVYQGEELGLEEVAEIPDEMRQDPTFFRTRGERVGRDGCRVPLPWSGDAPSFGFNDGAASWLPQPAHWAELTAARQSDDPESMLALYREAIRLRHDLDALGDGRLEWVESPSDVLAFVRPDGFACVTNFGTSAVSVPPGLPTAVLLASDLASTPDALAPDATIWLGM